MERIPRRRRALDALAGVLTITILLAAVCGSSSFAVVYVVHEVSDTQFDADWPALAHSPGGVTQVAWQEAGVGIWTQGLPTYQGDAWEVIPPVFQGPGVRPVLAWTWRGFLLAWIEGNTIKIRYGWDHDWGDPAQTIETGLDLQYAVLDLQGVVEAGWDVGWLALATGYGMDEEVYFLRVNKSSWDPPELIAGGLSQPGAQVAALPGVIQPLPRIYYFLDYESLAYRSAIEEGGWSPFVEVPWPGFGTEFDVQGRFDGAQAVLSLGPQPTCPCNTIRYLEQTEEGTWQEPVTLTVPYAAYDWPMSPQVGWDSSGRVHAFWLQKTANEFLEPGPVHLEYWLRDGDSWTDAGDFLDPYETRGLGSRLSMAVAPGGDPVFAWTRKDTLQGVPQPRRIWLARPADLAAVDQTQVKPGGLALVAWPNPGGSQIALSGTAPSSGVVALSVHDLAGRRVATLPLASGDGGQFAACWNGRDSQGRVMPAGVYLLHLTSAAGSVTQRVVWTR